MPTKEELDALHAEHEAKAAMAWEVGKDASDLLIQHHEAFVARRAAHRAATDLTEEGRAEALKPPAPKTSAE